MHSPSPGVQQCASVNLLAAKQFTPKKNVTPEHELAQGIH